MTIEELKRAKESEDRIEFKEAKGGNFSYNGGAKTEPKDRRKCILGYVIAFANEGGGKLVFGVQDRYPHDIVGTNQNLNGTGKLEQDIYRDLKIRVQTEELFDGGKRVLIIHIPSSPIGKVYKFEDVPLMRVGEELLPMSDERFLKIVSEQEPDFSSKICPELTLSDLDEDAIIKMKQAYGIKQNNPMFVHLDVYQCLSDLNLVVENKLTYAALILLGKQSAITKHLPQSRIQLEYRNSATQITFDDRQFYDDAFFVSTEKIWATINLRNGKFPVQEGPFIFDIPFFNQEVIREAVNNAVAHRDYTKTSNIVIKQSPEGLWITSPGGFPNGVNLSNILTINSTPRNRLLSDVLSKTGIVERSGQGVDKIFYQSLSEGKGAPDYSASDDFQVDLKISSIVKDKAFALFIDKLQKERGKEKLSVIDIVTLDGIREGKDKSVLNKNSVEKLLQENLIEKVGKTSSQKLRLSKDYYRFTNSEAKYTNNTPIDESYVIMRIQKFLEDFTRAKMGKFVELFEGQLTRQQVKRIVFKLSNEKVNFLEYEGEGKAREYMLGQGAIKNAAILTKALKLGLEQLKKDGQIQDATNQV